MPNPIQRALSAGVGALKAVNGVSVIIQRGSVQSAEAVTAIVGETEYEDIDDQGIVISAKSRDYLIAAADYVLGADDIQTEPRNGDNIIETVGSTNFVYEVCRIPGQKHFRPSDPYGTTLRIHTRLTRTTPAA